MPVQMPFGYDQETRAISVPLPGGVLFIPLEDAVDFFLQGTAFCIGVQKALLMAHDQKATEILDNPMSVVEDVEQFLKKAGGGAGEKP